MQLAQRSSLPDGIRIPIDAVFKFVVSSIVAVRDEITRRLPAP
jgi:hypothetical protein